MTIQEAQCGGCGAVLEYMFDERAGLNSIIVRCPVCAGKCCISLSCGLGGWGDLNKVITSPPVIPEVEGKVVTLPLKTLDDQLKQISKNMPRVDFNRIMKKFNVLVDLPKDKPPPETPAPPPVKWQPPKKLKGFDGLRAELDDLQKQTDVIRTVLLDKGKQIRSLQTENENLRSQLASSFKDLRQTIDRVKLLEKKYPNLDPKFHRAFPEKPNYVEWVSEDEELLEDGYNGFPKSKERVVF